MEQIQTNTPTKEKHYLKRAIVVLIFLAIVAGITYINIQGEYIQMREMGEQYLATYTQKLQYNTYSFIATFGVAFVSLVVTTIFIKLGLKKFAVAEKVELPKLPNKSISLILAVIIGLVASSTIAEKFMLAINPTYFAISDPIFNMDIGYYIFQKPFIELILVDIAIFLVALCIYVAAYYIFVFNKYFDGIDAEMLKKSSFIKQLVVNVIILACAVSAIVFVKTQDILFSNFISTDIDAGLTILGAGTADISIKLWGYRILSILILISVCFGILYIFKKDKKKVVISILLVPVFLICLVIINLIYNIMFVNGNEFDKQQEYISYNIANTKRAYNINIQEKELEYSGTLTLEEVSQNQDILQNIPIIDENTTLTTLREYQSNVGHYSFNNIHMAEYNNTLQYITPREILTSGTISNSSRVYEYTHGYSAIITSAVETDEYGNIKYIQSDFDNEDDVIKITEPRIYFGLETYNNIIVNSNDQNEYDYPLTTSTNATNSYNGEAGIKLNPWERFILGLKTGNMNIAFGINMNENSKIITNRQIMNRVKNVLPELIYDENPYMLITDEGKLVWVIDGYTVASNYPYSTSVNIEYNGLRKDINYIRNSVKVLIDAYNGTMKFYITDRDDPIIMAYNKIHPSLFESAEQNIPEDIQRQLVYPKMLYSIQSKVLTSYHNIQPEVLYRNDDRWEVATYSQNIGGTGKITKMEPYYTMVEDSRLGLVLPYTEYGKKNINAYLVGTYENSNKLTLYKFTSNNNALGPIQLENQIEEDETISAEIKSISVTGTKLQKNTLIIPVANTVLYVEPIYQIRLNETQIPVLKKVIVASGTKLAIGDNLKEALDNLLSTYAVNIDIEYKEGIDGLIDQIIRANYNLRESTANNNWEIMGRDMERLQSLINELEQMKKEADAIKADEAGINQTEAVETDGNVINEMSNAISVE